MSSQSGLIDGQNPSVDRLKCASAGFDCSRLAEKFAAVIHCSI